MADFEFQTGNGVRGSWKRCFLKHFLVMLIVLCAVGVTVYITGVVKSSRNSLEHMTKAKWQKSR